MIAGRLWFWHDRSCRPPAAQMALDQVLLDSGEAVLRLHGWDGPCATFGYFLRWRDLAGRVADQGLEPDRAVRRRTGGGLVFHDRDTAFTLACPTPVWRGAARFRDSQAGIHAALAGALQACGWPVETVRTEEGTDLDCFRHPVVDDLSWEGRKVVGAGQRRLREGLLHQGSLQMAAPIEAWGESFATALSEDVAPVDQGRIARWEALAAEREDAPAAAAWRTRR